MGFDLLGVDVLPRGQHDDLLAAARDRQPAGGVEDAQVAGVQPAVDERGGRRVGTAVVARHHDRPADRHLAVAIALGRQDADLDARQRRPDRRRQPAAGRRERGGAGALGEAVRLHDVEPETVQVAADRRVEARAARDEQAHARAHHGVDPREEQAPEVDPQPRAQPAVQRDERAERQTLQAPGGRHFLHHALVDQVVELRHAHERRDLALGERAQQVGRVHLLEKDDARAGGEGQQEVAHLRERVEERQDAEDRVALVHVDDAERRLALGEQVAVREDDALRVGRRARGVEHDRRVRRSGRARRRLRRVRRLVVPHVVEADERRPAAREEQRLADVAGARLQAGGGLEGDRRVARAGEDDARAAVAEQRGDLVRVVGGVERDRDGAEPEDAEVRGAPARVVAREDRAAVARADSAGGEPDGGAPGHPLQLAVADRVEPVVALDLDGRVPGEAGGRGGELLIEVVHARNRSGECAA